LIVSLYVPPVTFEAIEELDTFLNDSHLIPQGCKKLIFADSNLHHEWWNEPHYVRSDPRAWDLLEVMSDHDLTVRSQQGIPTFANEQGHKTVIDLVLVTSDIYDNVITCNTDQDLNFDHGSDHLAIITHVNLYLPRHPPTPRRNFRKLDHELAAKLAASSFEKWIDPSTAPRSIDRAIQALTDKLAAIAESTTPSTQITWRSRRWWNKDILNPLKESTSRSRRKAHKTGTPEDQEAWKQERKKYQNTIRREKRKHWRTWLATIPDDQIFLAAKYCNGNPISSTIPPLRRPNGTFATDPSSQADLLHNTQATPPSSADLSDIPPLPLYPPSLPSHDISIDEVKAAVFKSAPFKAPGPDGIPNCLIQATWTTIGPIVTTILSKCRTAGYFPLAWKQARTVILKKAGKPDYSDPSAYRPIALLSCLGKSYEAILANRLAITADHHNLLPNSHFGARKARTTTDALTTFISWTKNQWRKKKIVSALLVDVKSAFPTVNLQRLVHRLRTLGFPQDDTESIESFLRDRSTSISFGDFTSPQRPFNIGLPQGSPLSPILYILYNSELLTITNNRHLTCSSGYIDDITYGVAADTADECRTLLIDIGKHLLKWGTHYGAIFDTHKSHYITFTHNKQKISPLPLALGDSLLPPEPCVKWLGVWLDHKLSFKTHAQAAVRKGQGALMKLASLAKTTHGIPIDRFRQLITSLVHSRTDYGALAWHTFGKQTSGVTRLQKIDRLAQRIALGAFRTTPASFLLHDSNSLPTLTRLDGAVTKAAARLLALPDSNPAAVYARKAIKKSPKAHRSPLHHIFHSPTSFQWNKNSEVECINPADVDCSPWTPRLATIHIAASKEEAIADHAKWIASEDDTLFAYTDGSLIPEIGVGASAVYTNIDVEAAVRVGSELEHTVYEGELLGQLLAVDLLPDTPFPSLARTLRIFSDNTASVIAHTRPNTASPGQHLRHLFRNSLTRFLTFNPLLKVDIHWCPGHKGIPGNEQADFLAKSAAAPDPDSPPDPLPISLAALKQQIRKWNRSILNPRSNNHNETLRRLRGNYNPKKTLKMLTSLPRNIAALVVQLRSGHVPLLAYRHQFNQVPSPKCAKCNCIETVEHYLTTCRRYTKHRTNFRAALKSAKIDFNISSILSNPDAMPALSQYLNSTKRFPKALGPFPPSRPSSQRTP